MDKKKIAIICLSILLIISIVFIIILLQDNNQKKSEIYNKVYGRVASIKDDIVRIKDEESNRIYKIKTNRELSNGDVIAVYYNEETDILIPTDLVILSKNTDDIVIINTTSATTTSSTTTIVTTKETTTRVTTTKTPEPTTTTVFKKVEDTQTPLEFVKAEYESASSGSLKSTFKEGFIKIVDFIFYDTDINGYKFKDLTASAKAKIVYYALLLDGKIDELKPGYKNTLKSKYQDVKSELIAAYLGITTTVCKNHEDTCNTLKDDFSFLKGKLSISWDFIKSAFKYGYDKSTSFLTTWYEIFSGKR